MGYFGTARVHDKEQHSSRGWRAWQPLDVLGYIHCTVPVPEMISRPGAIRKLIYSVSARTLAVRPKRGV